MCFVSSEKMEVLRLSLCVEARCWGSLVWDLEYAVRFERRWRELRVFGFVLAVSREKGK